ncbi:MAG: hypothetical protein IEMM0003_0045 [bacterium]|nr:MAG: hypothetical protein IEMM0003_0045 [bacterium]
MIDGIDGNKNDYRNRIYFSAIKTAEYLDISAEALHIFAKKICRICNQSGQGL